MCSAVGVIGLLVVVAITRRDTRKVGRLGPTGRLGANAADVAEEASKMMETKEAFMVMQRMQHFLGVRSDVSEEQKCENDVEKRHDRKNLADSLSRVRE